MAGQFELIVGYIDKTVGNTSAAVALVDQFNSNKDGFALINQTAQTTAGVASVLSITAVTAGSMPFVSVATNTLAGTMTFLKIVADSQSERGVTGGDVWSLVGNVAGVVAGITILAGISAGAPYIAGVGIAAGMAGILGSDAAKNILSSIIQPVIDRNFKDQSTVSYQDYLVSPDLTFVTLSQINAHGSKVAVVRWDPSDDSISIVGASLDPQEGSASGGSGSSIVSGADSDNAVELDPNNGAGGGDASAVNGDGAPVDAGLESNAPPAPVSGGGSEGGGQNEGASAPIIDVPNPASSTPPMDVNNPQVDVPTGDAASSPTDTPAGDTLTPSPAIQIGDASGLPGGTVGGMASPAGGSPSGDSTPVASSDVDISIESLNGDPSKGHPPIPDEPQDSYGCCTNTQDTYA